MLKSLLYRLAAFSFLLLYFGCAGSGPEKEGKSVRMYNAQLGVSFHNEFSGVVEHILVIKYQYNIIRSQESPREIYLETEWKDRPVYIDEANMGITAAQTRFVIRAKARHKGQYKLSLQAESQVQYVGNSTWTSAIVTKMVKEYFDKISDDLKTEYRLLY